MTLMKLMAWFVALALIALLIVVWLWQMAAEEPDTLSDNYRTPRIVVSDGRP